MGEEKNGRKNRMLWLGLLEVGFPSTVCLVMLMFLISRPYRESWHWVHESFHALILSGGAFSVIFSALFFLAIQRISPPDPSAVWIATILLGMGILDGFHAVTPGALSLCQHSLATMVGGLALALFLLPTSSSFRISLRAVPYLMAIFCLLSGSCSMLFSDWISIVQTAGQFSSISQLFNVAGGFGFLAAWMQFARKRKDQSVWQKFLLANGSLFFAIAAFLPLLASPWDEMWWLWHMLIFFAYLAFCCFFLITSSKKIKEFQKTRKELEKSGKQFFDFIENLPSAVTMKDTAGRFVLVNKRFEEIFGLAKKDVVGKSAADIFPYIKDLKSVASKDIDELEVKTEYEENIPFEDGTKTFSTLRFPLTCNEEDLCCIGYVQTDITDRKELEYQVQLDQKIIENSREGIVVTDAEAIILIVNAAYTKITGYKPKEIVGKNPRVGQSGRHDRAFYKAMWSRLLETGRWSGEIWDRRKNGEIYQKKLTINAIHDNAGDIINYVGIFTDITEERKAERLLKDLLFYDPLTNLPNRTLFEELLAQALINSQSHDIPLVLLYVDLNHFKSVNDSLGYKAGDDLLVQVSKRNRGGVRKTDTVSRLCSDEFMIILSEIKLKEAVGHIVQHLLHLLRQPFYISGEKIFIDASIGISVYPEDGRDAETLIKNADIAMNFARKRNRENYQYFRIQMNE
ncbi:MAG: sensor domain-containing diguanylate cyclase, partial [Candidatus Electrothrix sp. AR4]|nr:sensor domain-containing diguanylate cyclase [Candidatus Electrothrix sp. AR4]